MRAGMDLVAETGDLTDEGLQAWFLYRLYLGIADGMSVARVWACRRRC